jgi:hypothetical protein
LPSFVFEVVSVGAGADVPDEGAGASVGPQPAVHRASSIDPIKLGHPRRLEMLSASIIVIDLLTLLSSRL